MSEQISKGDKFTSKHNPLGFRRYADNLIGENPDPEFTEKEFAAAVIGAVAYAAGISPQSISGKSRVKIYSIARHCAAYLFRTLEYGSRFRRGAYPHKDEWPGLSFPRIGKHLNRDHTTIQYGVERFGYRITAPGHAREKEIYTIAGEQLLKMGVA